MPQPITTTHKYYNHFMPFYGFEIQNHLLPHKANEQLYLHNIIAYEQAFPNCRYLPLTNTKKYGTSLKHILLPTYAKKDTKPIIDL